MFIEHGSADSVQSKLPALRIVAGICAARPVILDGCFNGTARRALHNACVQLRKVVRCQKVRIVAASAGYSLLINMFVVLPGAEAVVLRSTVGMTCRALSVDVDRAGPPVRRCLSSMAADVRTGIACCLECSGTGLGIVCGLH